MQMRKKLGRKYVLCGIAMILIVLALPHIMRCLSGNFTLMGERSHFNLRIASELAEKFELKKADALIYGGRSININPYDIFNALVIKSAGIYGIYLLIIFPAVFGIISAYIFFLILKLLGLKIMDGLAAVFVLMLSPAFLYAFSLANQDSMAILFTLIGIYLFIKKGMQKNAVGAKSADGAEDEGMQSIISLMPVLLFFILASMFSLFNTLLIVLFLAFYSMKRKSGKKDAFICISVLVLLIVLNPLDFYNSINSTNALGEFGLKNMLNNSITELGALTGFGIFYILLALIGFISTWKEKTAYYLLYAAILLLIVVSIKVGNESNVYANFPAAVLAGIGITKIREMKWELTLIKSLTLLIIICGLLFSAIAYANAIANSLPEQKHIEAFKYLKESTDKDAVVLSHPNNGFMIEYFGQRAVLVDNLKNTIKSYKEKEEDINALFMTWDIEQAKSVLKKYKIDYIVVDSTMKNGLVWNEKEQGLLFLFRNSETFKKIYDSPDIEIWKVIY